MNTTNDYPDLVRETQQIWEQIGTWWDATMGEGNKWHKSLIAPPTEKLLDVQPGARVLDLACGNGLFARKIAQLGADVVACDFSSALLECARRRTGEHSGRIDYQLIDLTQPEQLATLGTGRFDAAVCNMALMDIACITPLLYATCRALKSSGRFVFSVPHPCFNTNGTTMLAERDDYDENDGLPSFSVRVKRYRTLKPGRAIAIPGQPTPHYLFHRPLHELLGSCFAAGFVLDGLEEPAFESAAPDHSVHWGNCPEIPPVLIVRLRPRQEP